MVAAAIIGGAVVGAGASMASSSKAAGAQQDAANTAASTQIGMYNQTRADQTPWRTAGGQAVDALSRYYGLGGVGAQPLSYDQWSQQQMGNQYAPTGDGGIQQRLQGGQPTQADYQQYLAGFPGQGQDIQKTLENQPGYQFQFDQGQQAVQRNLAAKGLLNSGAAGKALTQYGQGMASQYANQYVNGLQSLAGLGQTSVGQTGQAGAAAANGASNAAAYGGNAAAAGYMNQANAINQGLSGVVQGYGYYQGQQMMGNNTYQDYARMQKMNGINNTINSWESTPLGG